MQTSNSSSKRGFFVLVAILFCFNLWHWMTRNEYTIKSPIISSNGRFTGGAYPDISLLNQLKSQGHTVIISLLDPLILPDEALLISEENKAAAALGLKVIHIPMLPGNVNSLAAEKQIKAIVNNTENNKYYVHSKHDNGRLLTFMNIVEENYHPNQIVQPSAALSRFNTINLERGTAIQLDKHVIISPKPTLDEFKRYFINTPNNTVKIPIRSVISLDNGDSSAESAEILSLFKTKGINYFSMPINFYPYDPQLVLAIIDKVKALPDSVLVYAYYMPPQSMAASAFILSYESQLPALPQSLFTNETMQGGSVKVIAPNVAIGPRPTAAEFKTYLKPRGISSIAFVGSCSGPDYSADMHAANQANLKWICIQTKNAMIYQVLGTGGPWFVYGPALPGIRNELSQYLSDSMPDHALLGE